MQNHTIKTKAIWRYLFMKVVTVYVQMRNSTSYANSSITHFPVTHPIYLNPSFCDIRHFVFNGFCPYHRTPFGRAHHRALTSQHKVSIRICNRLVIYKSRNQAQHCILYRYIYIYILFFDEWMWDITTLKII